MQVQAVGVVAQEGNASLQASRARRGRDGRDGRYGCRSNGGVGWSWGSEHSNAADEGLETGGVLSDGGRANA